MLQLRHGFTPAGGRLLWKYFRLAAECLQLAESSK